MRRERACNGCDGSGYVHRPDFFSDMPHTSHAATCWCGATECESCLGTGRVVDHIPAADAVADAETLRAAFWDEGGGAEWTDAPRGMLVNALRASDYGEASIAETCPAGRIQVVYAHAAAAARAAFRAVPGLRD